MNVEQRTDRARILAMASSAGALPEPHRRRAIMGLMRERYRLILSAADPRMLGLPCTEAEVFYAAYSDAGGRDYWAAWLFPGKATAEQLVWLLAAHISRSAEEFERVRVMLTVNLGSIDAQSSREMATRLVADPDARRFVPVSLRAFLDGLVSTATAPPASSAPPKQARRRGRRPVKRERVKAAMREALAGGQDVFGMKEVAMEELFKASRDVCRRARDELQ